MIKGITFSAFDLFHAGHVSMLSEAKGQCDYLIACIHADSSKENSGKNKPWSHLQIYNRLLVFDVLINFV